MFNSHLSSLGYFHRQEDEGVFLQFPNQTREILAYQICQCFMTGLVNHSTLTTCVHVRIMMECVGQSFSLPLSSYKIIESGIELYKRWLLDEKQRPQPIKEDEQFFFKELFKQLSIVFTKRQSEEPIEASKDSKSHKVIDPKNNMDSTTIHVSLCNQVLEIYRLCGRTLKNILLDDTWEALLKIVLGVADSMLTEPAGSSPVTESLTPNLLNLLFELWINSGPRSEEMWDKLKELTRRWKHRRYTFTQWSSTCYAINNRLLRLLYGPNQGTDYVLFKQVNGESIAINIDSYEISNTWYRMLHLLGSFEGSISRAENYYEAISGIGKIARSFIDLNKDSLSTKVIPDGNSIFNICGGWLLEAINHYQNDFDKGKDVALDVLCSLINSRPQCKFNPNYLAFFYKGIEKALNTRRTSFISVILTKSASFFQSEIEGSNVLIPAFIASIERIIFLEKSEKALELRQSSQLHELQRASLKIVSALFCLPNHFKDTKFTSVSSKSGFVISKLPSLNSYNDLYFHISEMLYEAINTISNPDNLQLALYLTSCFCYDIIDQPNQKNFINRFILLLLDKLMLGKWDQRNILNTLTILSNLSSVFHQLGDNKETLAQSVVMTICKLIELKYFAVNNVNGDEVVINGYLCLLNWVSSDQWIVNSRDCLKVFLDVIDIALNPKSSNQVDTSVSPNSNISSSFSSPSLSSMDKKKEEFEASEKVKLAAEYVFSLFFNYLGNFPSFNGPASLSSLQTENELLAQYGLDNRSLTCYVANNVILNIIRFPRDSCTEVIAIVRDGVGKYIWKSKLNYFIERTIAPPPIQFVQTKKNDSSPLLNDAEKLIANISSRLNESDREVNRKIEKSVSFINELESNALKKINYGFDDDVSKSPPVAPTIDYTDDLTVTRLFVSTFGFNSLENPAEFSQIYLNYSKMKDDLTTFNALDQSNIRECFSAAILYFKPNRSYLLGDHHKLSDDYQHFVSKIGWNVILKDHSGYKAGLTEKICETTPYYANVNCEMTFRVGTFANDVTLFKTLIADNSIYISWVEDIHSYSPKDIKFDYIANIVINPLPNRLYRIRIFTTDDYIIGPLQDDMIISKQILAHTVRLTVLNLSKLTHSTVGKPLYVRKALIELQKQSSRDSANSFHKTHISQFI